MNKGIKLTIFLICVVAGIFLQMTLGIYGRCY
jgi:hypothetical protein